VEISDEDFERAVTSQRSIGIAGGVLMSQSQLTKEQAFESLARAPPRTNVRSAHRSPDRRRTRRAAARRSGNGRGVPAEPVGSTSPSRRCRLAAAPCLPLVDLWWRQRENVKLIDFDDCGTGPCIYELGVALWELRDQPNYPAYGEALLTGYRARREIDVEHLDDFIALRQVAFDLWYTGTAEVNPAFAARLDRVQCWSLAMLNLVAEA
jgi:hypothetical protein